MLRRLGEGEGGGEKFWRGGGGEWGRRKEERRGGRHLYLIRAELRAELCAPSTTTTTFWNANIAAFRVIGSSRPRRMTLDLQHPRKIDRKNAIISLALFTSTEFGKSS